MRSIVGLLGSVVIAAGILLAGCSRETPAEAPQTAVETTPESNLPKAVPGQKESSEVSPSSSAASATATLSDSGKTTAADPATSAVAAAVETSGTVVIGVVKLPDGTPAEGTTVTLGTPDMAKAQRMLFVMTKDVSVVTGADGRFRLTFEQQEEPKSPMPLILRAQRPQSATVHMMIAPPAMAKQMGERWQETIKDGAIEREITLKPAAPIRGRVVDENSAPLAGVTVTAMIDLPSRGAEMMKAQIFRDDAVSGEDGTFELDELAAGQYNLAAEEKDRIPGTQTASAPAEDVKIVLAKGSASVLGNVYDYGTRAAIAGASVTLNLVQERPAGGNFVPPITKQAETDQVGTFKFEGLGPGKYMLAAMKNKLRQVPEETKQGQSTSRGFTLGNSQTTEGLALFLYPGHTIHGLVRDAKSSSPLEGVKASVGYATDKREAVSDSQGKFRLEGVFGTYAQLQVEKKGYTLAPGRDRNSGVNQPGLSLSMKDLSPQITIDLTESVTVSGVVKTQDETPVGGAKVKAYTADHDYSTRKEIETDSSGKYEMEVKPYTRLRLEARASGYPPAVSENVVEVFDESVTGVDIILKQGTSVSGRVVTFEGKPAENAKVSVTSWAELGNTSYSVEGGDTRTDAEGNFTLTNVQPADVRVKAELTGYTDSEALKLDMSSGEPKSGVELVLRKSHFISGKITGPDGKPLSGVSVNAYSPYGEGTSANANSDAEGKYRLEGLTEGKVTINVWSSEHGNERRENVAVDQENVDFQMGTNNQTTRSGRPKTGVKFVGYVVDWKTGEPVKDFTISGSNTQDAVKDPDNPGRILVENYASGWAIQFLIDAPGYMSYDTGYFSPDEKNGQLEKTFRLGPGGAITGRVVDKESKPLADVRVLLKGVGESYEVNRRAPEQSVKTDADGRFSVEKVNEGANRITVRAPEGLTDKDVTADVKHGETADLGEIMLSGGGRVTGRVLRSPGDTPVAGVRVKIMESMNGADSRDARTDENGAFEFSGLKNVQYSVSLPDYSIYNGFTQADDQTREIVLRVGGATIHGRVLRGTEPVRGSVSLTQPDGNSMSSSTKADGSYEFKGAVGGTWQISAYAYNSTGSSGNLRETIEVPNEGDLEKDLIFPGGRIVGRVEDEEGKPVSGARVAAQPPVGTGGATDSYAPETVSAQSDSEGRFSLDGLKAGAYGVTARATGKMALASGVQVPENGESAPVVLRIGAGGGTIVSTVLSLGTGTPVKEAWLILSNQNGRFQHGATRGDDGVMTVENVPPGTYQVQVSSYGFSINDHTIEVKEGETVRLDDVLYDAGALRWTIQTGDGKAVAGARCRVTPDDPNSIESPREGQTASDGLLVVRGLYPGSYTGTVTTPAGGTATEKITIIAHELTNTMTKIP